MSIMLLAGTHFQTTAHGKKRENRIENRNISKHKKWENNDNEANMDNRMNKANKSDEVESLDQKETGDWVALWLEHERDRDGTFIFCVAQRGHLFRMVKSSTINKTNALLVE